MLLRSSPKAQNDSAGYQCQVDARTLRYLVVFMLLVTAVVVGVVTYLSLSVLEDQKQDEQYISVARKLEVSTINDIDDKIFALSTVGAAMSYASQSADSWPNVAMPIYHYDQLVYPLTKMVDFRALSFSPFVMADEVDSFEKFAFQYFDENGRPDLDTYFNVTGIYAVNETTELRYHDKYGSDTTLVPNLLAPIMSIGNLTYNRPALLYNLYSEKYRAEAIDYTINCSKIIPEESSTYCGTLTDVIHLVQDEDFNPASVIMVPILLKPNVTNMNESDDTIYKTDFFKSEFPAVGIVSAEYNWNTIFSNSFSEAISGIDIVLKCKDRIFSFTCTDGKCKYTGLGDLHEQRYNDQEYNFVATPSIRGPLSFTISVYPNHIWMEEHATNVPYIISAATVAVVLFTSLVLYLYDSAMKLEAREKELILDTKRQFVRYISHEIRTPMNTVHLGMKLLSMEISRAIESVQIEVLDDSHYDSISGPGGYEITIGANNNNNNVISNIKNCMDGILTNIYKSRDKDREYIDKGDDEDESAVEKLQNWLTITSDIIVSSDAAITVLNDLINYDKLDTGKLNIEYEEVRIWEVIKTSVGLFNTQAKHALIEMKVDLPIDRTVSGNVSSRDRDRDIEAAIDTGMEGTDIVQYSRKLQSLVVLGDTVKLDHVIRNLVSNALKFTPPSGQVTITAEWRIHGLPEALISPDVLKPKSPTNNTSNNTMASSYNNDENVRYERAGSVIVRVTDSGAGLSKENLAHLFQEGVQFDANKLQSGNGSGLGLYISKGVVKLHEGRISATSEGLDHGSVFAIELPAFIAHHLVESQNNSQYHSESIILENISEDNFRVQSSERQSQKDKGKGRENVKDTKDKATEIAIEEVELTVLVVDDSNITRKMLCKLLKLASTNNTNLSGTEKSKVKCRYKCLEAEDGVQCVEIVKSVYSSRLVENSQYQDFDQEQDQVSGNGLDLMISSQYKSQSSSRKTNATDKAAADSIDIILMDYEMPRMNGPSATAALIKEGFGDIPVVGVTGNVLPEDQQYFMQCGAKQVLHKPVTLEQLESTIQQLVDVKQKAKINAKVSEVREREKERLAVSTGETRTKDSKSLSSSSKDVVRSERMQVVEEKKAIVHVLVVDDSQINRKMICRILQLADKKNKPATVSSLSKAYQYLCMEANDGVECMELVRSQRSSGGRIDIILMDYEMPRMNGPSATAALIKEGFGDIPVVGVTGNVLPEDQQYFMQCGAKQVLHKPVTLEQLEKSIAEFVNINNCVVTNTTMSTRNQPQSTSNITNGSIDSPPTNSTRTSVGTRRNNQNFSVSLNRVYPEEQDKVTTT